MKVVVKIQKSKLTHMTTVARHWRYWNSTLLVLSVTAFIFLARTPSISNAISQIGSLGYIGSFITGVMFVSTFTAVPATFVLFEMADKLNPVMVAIFAGFGAMVGDYLIFRFFQDKVFDELKPIFTKLSYPAVRTLFKTPYFAWLLPVIGAVMIASPLPDEVGIGMLGLSKIKKWQFLAVTYLLNVVGIFLVVTAARL